MKDQDPPLPVTHAMFELPPGTVAHCAMCFDVLDDDWARFWDICQDCARRNLYPPEDE